MPVTVAIVGRPNVGKSTLFNRLVGRRTALVDDTPGVTRDRRRARVESGALSFDVIDTAGLEESAPESLATRMVGQTARAVDEADLALFVVDGRAGITNADRHFAAWLRTRGRPVVVVVNKCEARAGLDSVPEAFELGFGDPVAVSAEHGLGMPDLHDAIAAAVAARADDGAVEDGESPDHPLRLAIVGRPNVGKSTLVNRLTGEDRILTGPEAGITRDPVAVEWSWRDQPVELVDTAGLRRKARVADRVESLSVAETMRVIRFAEVVVLVLDGQDLLERQDLTIARGVIDEGRALVVAVNKWDLVDDPAGALRALRDRMETSLPQAHGLRYVTLSAKFGEGLDKLMDTVVEAYAVWNRRVPTGALNRWLGDMVDRHPPPLAAGRRVRLRYITQVKARPPTFALFCNKPKAVPESYLRYLTNGLRDAFAFAGVPIRISLRKGDNPYDRAAG